MPSQFHWLSHFVESLWDAGTVAFTFGPIREENAESRPKICSAAVLLSWCQFLPCVSEGCSEGMNPNIPFLLGGGKIPHSVCYTFSCPYSTNACQWDLSSSYLILLAITQTALSGSDCKCYFQASVACRKWWHIVQFKSLRVILLNWLNCKRFHETIYPSICLLSLIP